MINQEDKTITLDETNVYEVEIFHFVNGMFAVFDVRSAYQIPQLQGRDAKDRISEAYMNGHIKFFRCNGCYVEDFILNDFVK